jgi:hypothetical protein
MSEARALGSGPTTVATSEKLLASVSERGCGSAQAGSAVQSQLGLARIDEV